MSASATQGGHKNNTIAQLHSFYSVVCDRQKVVSQTPADV